MVERASVLVVDDNFDMRDYVSRLLSVRYNIEVAVDGLAALEMAREHRPDLVLTDVMMPRLDGFGLLRELRSDPDLRDVPVIMLSARASEEASIEGLEAGADDYLTKPFSARELLARVRANLDLAALRRESVRIEKELRHEAELARERAESILASINDGFFAIDPGWRFTYINAAAQRILNESAQALIGKSLWDQYPEAAGGVLEANYRRAMTERVSVAFQYYYAPCDRWFDIRAYPAYGGGLSVYFQDFTEAKHAEEALRRLNETLEAQVLARTAELRSKEARLRTVFETSFTFQGLVALDGILLDANLTSLAAVGVALDEVVGKPFWEAPWFSGTPGMAEAVQKTLIRVANGETVRQEIHVNLPVGGWRWFDFAIRPLRDGQGNVIAIVPEAVELTARREAEEALRHAQKMEAIGQLTGGVAHDFNNLLQIIVGNLYVLQKRVSTGNLSVADGERLTGAAIRGAQRAATLTQKLLAFSRRQPLDPKPLEVNHLIAGMLELLRRALGENIRIQTALSNGLWTVLADSTELENALINLAVNARDAMPEGGKLTIETSNVIVDEVRSAAHEGVNPGQYTMIAVADTGMGMTKDVIAKAFEPFFTTKDIGHGTGLGLSQVYGFVNQSGGRVNISSEPGSGTTVRIYMPRLLDVSPKTPDEVSTPTRTAER